MKKLTMMAAMAIAAASFLASCGNNGSKPSLKTDVDSLSYAMGMVQTQGLKPYLAQMEIDTTYMASFVKGLRDGVSAGDDKKKAAYLMGVQIGQQISGRMVKGLNHELFGEDSTQTVSLKNLIAGFTVGATGRKGAMTMEQAQQVAQTLMQTIKGRTMEKTYGPYRKQNEAWLAANAKKAGVKALPSGLQYKVIKEGAGAMPKDTSKVTVNYEGRLIDGTVFDSTEKSGRPVTFQANQVIKGWTEALVHMPAGSVWEVYVPASLGYGEREMGQIKPFSTLVFKIELVSVD